jgi:hypothetical protein
MGLNEMEQARHATEKGQILRCLAQEYGREMTSVRNLSGALDLLGTPMSGDALQFSLIYLAEQGLIRIWRGRDTPGWRSDREQRGSMSAETIVFAKLLPKGLQLVDGIGAEDLGIRF